MTKIKICGIKTLNDALLAVDAGADYLGFNFYPKSVRFVEPSACARIVPMVKREHPQIQVVGVFVNSSVAEIKHVMQICSLDLAQLHGDETPALLVDASVKDKYGGSGTTADWSAAAELAKRVPLLLAGGLTPENVAKAVRRVQPWGVDVASGVEAGPGQKDAEKASAFVRAVRQADNQV